jgi:hypothetical protein
MKVLGQLEDGLSTNDHFFTSSTNRVFLDQVAKELKLSPGPGSYDTQIQEKLKALNH